MRCRKNKYLKELSEEFFELTKIENDGKESLSVQITMTSTIRYDQVGTIDLYDNDVISQPIVLQDTAVVESIEPNTEPEQIDKPTKIEITI